MWTMNSYSTEDLLMALVSHSSVYGAPKMIVTDRGTQIVAAAGGSPDWNRVEHSTAATGTAWRFIPPAAPWHNGIVERVIGLLKASILRVVHAGELLDLCQLQTLLHRVAYTLNERPLSASSFTASDFQAITPNDLLLGGAPARSAQEIMGELASEDTVERLAARVQAVESRVQSWWSRFFKDVFPLLVPRPKWKQEHRDVELGDVVLVLFLTKHDKNKYRLGRVLELHPDARGKVRVVTVGVRNKQRAIGEPHDVCTAGLRTFQAPVQRLVVVLPAEEQPREIVEPLHRAQHGGDAGAQEEDQLQEHLVEQEALGGQEVPLQEGGAQDSEHPQGHLPPEKPPPPPSSPQPEPQRPLPQRLTRRRAWEQADQALRVMLGDPASMISDLTPSPSS